MFHEMTSFTLYVTFLNNTSLTLILNSGFVLNETIDVELLFAQFSLTEKEEEREEMRQEERREEQS